MCEVHGCERRVYSRGLCEPHYRRRRRTGDVGAAVAVGQRAAPKPCMAGACDRTATERGLCHGHYLRLVRLGHLEDDRPLGRRKNALCTVEGCRNTATARGLCPTHRMRERTTGDVRADVPIRQAAGTGHLSHGYRVVPIPRDQRWLVHGRRTELEHRFVMAQMLGRALSADESVHHRNGDRLDNRPQNLELWSRFQPRGQRVADKLEFALNLLARYLPEVLRPAEAPLTVVPPTGFEPVPPP